MQNDEAKGKGSPPFGEHELYHMQVIAVFFSILYPRYQWNL
jgi:hypothetical protein